MTAKSALVTGGSRGIGLGITRRLLTDGYRVVVNGVRPATDVEETLAELSGLGEVHYVAANIGDPGERATLVETTLEMVGRLDVLVNNAGITSPGRHRDLLEATEEDFDTVMAVNLKGPFFLSQATARHMIGEHEADPGFRGCIVNVTSISAVLASVNRADYCISKAGLVMATMVWATRLAEHGIDVYEVRPGVIATDMTAPVEEQYDRLIAEGLTVERRWGTPDDVGAAVAALAAGNLPYATGQVLTIDGGLTIGRL
jgi:NAD(P)-dependent dehydrogenase (short-subunit alcohol dehydrogenase family)